MIELSMHILDIVENSTRAGATRVSVIITENTDDDVLTIQIADNGEGMDRDTIENALDPFYTTKKVRTIGLGLPMLLQATKMSDGHFSIESDRNKGTQVTAEFKCSHIDRQPMGDIASTVISLITGNPDTDFRLTYRKNDQEYTLDTNEIKREVPGIAINIPEVLAVIKENICEGLKEIGAGD